VSAAIAERTGAMAAVRQLLDGAADGHGGALFIVGEAGLGKTTMLEYALSQAEGRFQVGVGRGDRVEAALPFGLISQVLEPLSRRGHQDRLLRTADVPAEDRFYDILRRFREAAAQPLLLAFDDLHWADPDSRTALHLLCRRLAPLPLAVIATARPWPAEAGESARELAVQGVAAIEQLRPLSPDAAVALLRAAAEKPLADAVIEPALGLCGGNPLLLHYLGTSLREGADIADARTLVPIARFADLGEIEQRYLQAASVLGNRFLAATAEQIAALSQGEIHRLLPGLFKAGLLRDGDQGWTEFTHALVRQAVYEDLAPPLRRRLHEAAFRILVRAGAHPAEAAEHAIVARLTGDPEAVAALTRAGREAFGTGAVRTARRHLEAAGDLAGDAATPELLMDLGKVLVADGATQLAIEVNQKLLLRSGLDETTRITALGQLARAAFTGGQLDFAANCVETAVGLAEDSHRELAFRTLLDHAFLRLLDGPRPPLPLLERARKLADEAPVPLAACNEAAWGMCSYLCGDRRGLAAAEQAVKRARFAPSPAMSGPHWAWDPVILQAKLCTWTGRFAEAERLFREVLDRGERQGEPMLVVQASSTWVDCLCRLGRLAEALSVSDHFLELAELAQFVPPLATASRARVLVQMGRHEEASEWLQRLESLPAEGRRLYLVGGISLQLRGTIALRTGDLGLACRCFAELERQAAAWGLIDPCQVLWAGDAVDAYLASGREPDARRIIASLESKAGGTPSQWPELVATVGRAVLAERSGDRALAEETFASALGMDSAMPLVRAQTLTAYGAFLNRSAGASRARPLLADAVRIAEACGAEWHASRAR
jgi:tetratricopeptide (TPR) repeat protein